MPKQNGGIGGYLGVNIPDRHAVWANQRLGASGSGVGLEQVTSIERVIRQGGIDGGWTQAVSTKTFACIKDSLEFLKFSTLELRVGGDVLTFGCSLWVCSDTLKEVGERIRSCHGV
jgi:hypothetical protein